MSNRTWLCASLAAWALLAGSLPPTGGAPKPAATTAPADDDDEGLLTTRWDGPKDEYWLACMVQEELRRAVGPDRREELAKRLEAVALARLSCGRVDAPAGPTEIVHALRACKYLAPLEAEPDSGDAKLARWLLEHADIRRRLFHALDDMPSPKEALARFRELQVAQAEKLLEYPNLAVAFATANTLRYYKPQPEPATLVQSFLYYADAKKKFRYNLKKMPYELSRYLADTRAGIAEREWAYKRYLRVRDPGAAYFDVKYDYDYFLKKVPKKISKLPYTLPNLRKVGGVCIEQAYYAGEVCKALGIPATIVSGRGESGIGHAWLACLKISRDGREAYWDSRTGRYEEQQYLTGELREPAAREMILDSELMLLGAAAQLPLSRREDAYTAVILASLADRARDERPEADLSVLVKLAELYDQRIGSKAGKTPARVDWIKAYRKIDLALVEELLSTAIARNLAYKPAWEFIVDLRKADRMPVADLDRFFDVLVTRTAKTYPDYSCVLVMRIVPTLADADQRETVYKRATGVYGDRPDLYSRILIALGDDYADQGKKELALRAYEQAALRCVDFAPVVLAASERAEQLLLDAKRRDLAIQMYKKLFSRAKKSRTAFQTQTAHYQLGKRLAGLLREAGQDRAAERVEDSL